LINYNKYRRIALPSFRSAKIFVYRPDTTNSFFGEFVSPAEGRQKKIRVIHSVPDLGGFGVSIARNSFHPAARNETLFEAASLQAGLQGWVEQLHGDGSWSGAAQPRQHPPPCHALNSPSLQSAPGRGPYKNPPSSPSPCSGLLQPHAQHIAPMQVALATLLDQPMQVAARAP
jgi:hypothetical protein